MNYDDLVLVTIEATVKTLKAAGREPTVPAVVVHAAEVLFKEVDDLDIYAKREVELCPIVEQYLATFAPGRESA